MLIVENNLQNVQGALISDADLDSVIIDAKYQLPNFGERMVIGYIKSLKLNVTRRRIRQAIHRVDPGGVAERRELKNRRFKR